MPGHQVHNPACVVTGVAVSLFAATHGAQAVNSWALLGGSISGTILTPDLDLINPIRHVPIIGWLWGIWWWPYRKMIPHRSPMSHFPVLGTSFRVLSAFWPLFVWWIFTGGQWPDWFMYWFLGLVMADLVHVLLDVTVHGHHNHEG